MVDQLLRFSYMVVFLAAISTAGCTNTQALASSGPLPAQAQVALLEVDGVSGVTVDRSNALVLDQDGVYFCLLRRSDDLAEMRSRYFNHELGG